MTLEAQYWSLYSTGRVGPESSIYLGRPIFGPVGLLDSSFEPQVSSKLALQYVTVEGMDLRSKRLRNSRIPWYICSGLSTSARGLLCASNADRAQRQRPRKGLSLVLKPTDLKRMEFERVGFFQASDMLASVWSRTG